MPFDKENLIKHFQSHFQGHPRVFQAPGRVNLIGEHTDYNDGFVLPMAVGRTTGVAAVPRTDRKLNVWSENMDEGIMIDLDDNETKRGHWSDYVAGIAGGLKKMGIKLEGADMYIDSDIPIGAGLSSSAAIETASALSLLGTVNRQISKTDLVRLAQRAENEFVGMNCGIMDQFVSIFAEKGKALFLDCRTLDYRLVPLPVDQAGVVICNTMVKHDLRASEYTRRRAECEEGVRLLRELNPHIGALRDVDSAQFRSIEDRLPAVIRKRCRHVITENERTLASIEALGNLNLKSFGELMNASHDSLRDDYEVSCRELDLLVDIARSLPGVLGARMTGAGFGGCTVNLVRTDLVEHFCKQICTRYSNSIGHEPEVFVSSPGQGAHELE